MPGEIVNSVKNILSYVDEIKNINIQLDILRRISKPSGDQKLKIENLASKRKQLIQKIEEINSKIYGLVNPPQLQQNKSVQPAKVPLPKVLPKPQIVMPKPRETPAIAIDIPKEVPQFQSTKFLKLAKEDKKRYIKELDIKPEYLKKFIEAQKKKSKGETKISLKKEDYTIYKPSEVGVLANKLMKKYADSLATKYPRLFEPMFNNFKMVEMELLSRTYISMMLLFTVISLPLVFLFFLALNFAFHLSIITIILISILGMIFTFFGFYFYPASLIGGKDKKIKLELPFALVHMSAVAGSGAQPISIFQLIADSDEYPELKKEIKKILNYVNLFGYNLTNALKNVAYNTPNPELKEILNGMISTIETGGDLRGYLKEKADEALNTYKLDRKKQVEALATYSEIYTAILIASPLLLLITLAIINSIGGSFGGLSISTLAWLGILGAMPLLNIGFMVFISISQKGT